MTISAETIWKEIEAIRKGAPLVHNITNYVVMNNTANALLALGASPVMAHAANEVEDMAGISSSVVINIGTLSDTWIEAMFLAARVAIDRAIPLVLDPVGVGATTYRTETARKLLDETPPTLIRGNASEIMALAGEHAATKGVDSAHGSHQAEEAAKALMEDYGCAVCISGETDIIVSPEGDAKISNGHPMMPKVTGLGCTATALCGAFAAVNPDPLMATAHAMATMGIAGEMAAEQAKGPGTLQMHFIDALYNLDQEAVTTRLKTTGGNA